MFCTKCGKEIPDGSKVCMYCGASMKVEEPQSVDAIIDTKPVVENVSKISSETVEASDITVSDIVETPVADVINDSIADVVSDSVVDTVSEVLDAPEATNVSEVVSETITESNVIETPMVETSIFDSTTPVAPQSAPAPQPIPVSVPVTQKAVTNTTKPKKKGNAGLVVAIIVLLLILAAAGIAIFLFLTSPYNKIKKAVANNDIETVCKIYPDLKDAGQKEFVQNSMWNYAVSLEDQYKDEAIEYDVAMKDIEALNKVVLKGDKELKALIKDMDALEESRNAFADAEKAFKKGNYEEAYEKYSLVIEDDSNYKSAKKKMAECEEYMLPPITGVWKCDFDMGDALLEEMGAAGNGYNISWPMTFTIEFNEDGTGMLYMDEDDFLNGMNSAIDDIVSIAYDMLEDELKLSRTEIDEMFASVGSATVEEMILAEIEDELGISSVDFSNLSSSFNYEFTEDEFTITSNGVSRSATYYMDGDYMVITGGFFEEAESFGLTLPAYFKLQ